MVVLLPCSSVCALRRPRRHVLGSAGQRAAVCRGLGQGAGPAPGGREAGCLLAGEGCTEASGAPGSCQAMERKDREADEGRPVQGSGWRESGGRQWLCPSSPLVAAHPILLAPASMGGCGPCTWPSCHGGCWPVQPCGSATDRERLRPSQPSVGCWGSPSLGSWCPVSSTPPPLAPEPGRREVRHRWRPLGLARGLMDGPPSCRAVTDVPLIHGSLRNPLMLLEGEVPFFPCNHSIKL